MPDAVVYIAASIAVMGLVFWCATLSLAVIAGRRLRDLSEVESPAPATWPRVSVVIPACNEVGSLGVAARAHLETSYPDVEFLLVDDRSTDGTGALVESLAQGDRRIRPLYIDRLPDGWLGKVHALQVGWEHAGGDWVLFTDADVRIAPDTLKRAVSLCEHERRDFLTVIPRFLPIGPVVDAAVTAMARAVFGGGQVWRAEEPDSRQVAGFGAFLLVRRATFERTAGLEYLRMEVADDLGIGQIIKQAGGRLAVVTALDHVGLRFYETLADMRGSLEKGGFGIVGRYRLSRLAALCLLSLTLELGPFAAFLPGGPAWLTWIGFAGVSTALVASLGWARLLGRPPLSGVLFPVGAVLNAWFDLRSGVIGWRNGGIRWRGTFYAVEELRSGQRVRWP